MFRSSASFPSPFDHKAVPAHTANRRPLKRMESGGDVSANRVLGTKF